MLLISDNILKNSKYLVDYLQLNNNCEKWDEFFLTFFTLFNNIHDVFINFSTVFCRQSWSPILRKKSVKIAVKNIHTENSNGLRYGKRGFQAIDAYNKINQKKTYKHLHFFK